jgi:CDP-diacylglycerol--glycerol-3-phosphate 3-phosphatidyltransferase
MLLRASTILSIDIAIVKSHTLPMTLADRITLSRIVLAPILFIAYYAPAWFGTPPLPSLAVTWILFLMIELSDFFDGKAARERNEVKPFGKLFDPFADVIARMTYFVCFAFDGIMPLWSFLIIMCREYSILFIRMLVMQKGIAMGARFGGKLKAALYMLAGMVSLFYITQTRTGFFSAAEGISRSTSFVLYVTATVVSVASFLDYWILFRKTVNASDRIADSR